MSTESPTFKIVIYMADSRHPSSGEVGLFIDFLSFIIIIIKTVDKAPPSRQDSPQSIGPAM